MQAEEIKLIEVAGRTGRYVSPRDISRLCQHTLRLRQVVIEAQKYLKRINPDGFLKAMVDTVLED